MPSSESRRLRSDMCIIAGLIGLTVAAYSGIGTLGFVFYDDHVYTGSNPIVSRGLTGDGLRYAFTTFDVGNWMPLTWLSFELDAALFGPGPFGFHLTNLLLHAANVVLLFLWLQQMTGIRWASAVVAALFAVHPLHVESVAWIAERKDVLSGLFFFLSLIAYTHYARRPGIGRYLLVWLLFLAALLSKPMVVTLPLLMCLLDIWPLRRVSWKEEDPRPGQAMPQVYWLRLITEKLPLLALSLLEGLLTLAAQSDAGAMSSMARIPADQRMGNALIAVGWYVWKTLLPTRLMPMYLHPKDAVSWGLAGLSAAMVIFVSYWAVRGKKTTPWRIVGWGWYLISLLPALGLIQVGQQAYADRYMYLPQVGLLLLIVWEIRDFAIRRNVCVRVLAFSAAAICLLFGGLTWLQVRIWENRVTLWNHVLAIDPDHWHANFAIGWGRIHDQDYAGAVAAFEKALERETGHYELLDMYGFALNHLGRKAEARTYFERALQLDPSRVEALHNLSRLMIETGDLSGARRLLEPAVQWHPEIADFPLFLGMIDLQEHDPQRARSRFEEALRLQPDHDVALLQLGLALEQLGRPDEARQRFRQALDLNPHAAEAHAGLGRILEQEGNFRQARDEYAAAVRIAPDHPEASHKVRELEEKLSRSPPAGK